MNNKTLTHIKPNALLINAARGDIIDEHALKQRKDLTLVIDCWHNEPHIDNELLTMTHLATPHIAGHALDAKYRGGEMVAHALAHWLNRPPIAYPVLEPSTPMSLSTHSGQDLEQLHHILKQAYDFTKDDHVLRHAIPEQRAQPFEQYRRDYPDRWEWHHFSIEKQNLNPNVMTWTQALGFKH
jgi:erythronate-4-phosphate dehydrogenase